MKPSVATAYTPGEELANAVTHGLGIALSVTGLAVLVTFASLRGDAWSVTATAIFGASLVLLYTASTLYHSFRSEALKRLLRKFDHAAIFLLIAGTYTPFLLVSLRGPWGWSLLGVIWALAVGWLVMIAVRPMLHAVPPSGLWLLLAGGLCYTVGTAFYVWKRLPYHHAIWHLFVLGGSFCHFFAVWSAVMPAA